MAKAVIQVADFSAAVIAVQVGWNPHDYKFQVQEELDMHELVHKSSESALKSKEDHQ